MSSNGTGIDPLLLSKVDTRNLSSSFLAAAQRFYADPNNIQRFENWIKTKDAHSPISVETKKMARR